MSVGQVPVVRTNPWSLSTFCEGPQTLGEKITGVVIAILTSMASFFLFPKPFAVVLTGALVVLCATFCGANQLVGELPRAIHYTAPLWTPAPPPVVTTHPVLLPPRQHVPIAPEISHLPVNGQVQPVLNQGARQVAGTERIVAPHAQFQQGAVGRPAPQFRPGGGDHQARAIVGRPNS